MMASSKKKADAVIVNLRAVLLNVPGQEYILGRTYPTSPKESEEFIYCPYPELEPRHCKIWVDDQFEFWIKNESDYACFSINDQEAVKNREGVKLEFGDRIVLGGIGIEIDDDGIRNFDFPIFNFEFKEVKTPRKQRKSKFSPIVRTYYGRVTPLPPIASEVAENDLIVESILKHLTVAEIVKYRLVSKNWDIAASQLIRERCAVSLPASTFSSKGQTTLFQCSKEMGKLKSIKSLSLGIPKFLPNEEGHKEVEKFCKDLLKYQLQEPLSYLKISATISTRRDSFSHAFILDKIFEKVSPTLEHLVLDVAVGFSFEFAGFSPDWKFSSNLKILEVRCSTSPQFIWNVLQKIDHTSLEKFVGRDSFGSLFLPALGLSFNRCPISNLTEMSLIGVRHEEISSSGSLPYPSFSLKKLVLLLDPIGYVECPDISSSVSNLLQWVRETLVSLKMRCFGGNKIVLPVFEKLEVFNLFYDDETRFTFPSNFLYSTHFPALKSLTLNSISIDKILARSCYTGCGWFTAYSYPSMAKAVKQWNLNPSLFNSFFPRRPNVNGNREVCLTRGVEYPPLLFKVKS